MVIANLNRKGIKKADGRAPNCRRCWGGEHVSSNCRLSLLNSGIVSVHYRVEAQSTATVFFESVIVFEDIERQLVFDNEDPAMGFNCGSTMSSFIRWHLKQVEVTNALQCKF